MVASVNDPVARRGPSRGWLVVAALALLVLIGIGYALAGVALAASATRQADSALNTTLADKGKLGQVFDNDPFKEVVLLADNPNISGDQQVIANMKSQLASWHSEINRDRALLLKARDGLGGSPLTLPQSSNLDKYRRRVEGALSALDSAEAAVKIQQKQVAFLGPSVDVIAGFVSIGKAGDRNDTTSMLTELNKTEAAVQTAVSTAQGADLPPQITFALNTMQQAVEDMKAVVAAVVAGDSAKLAYSLEQLAADGQRLGATDQSKIEEAQRLQFKPLKDAYDSGMRLAAA